MNPNPNKTSAFCLYLSRLGFPNLHGDVLSSPLQRPLMRFEVKVDSLTFNRPSPVLHHPVPIPRNIHHRAKGINRRIRRNRPMPDPSATRGDPYLLRLTLTPPIRIHWTPPPISFPAAAIATMAIAGGHHPNLHGLDSGRRADPRSQDTTGHQQQSNSRQHPTPFGASHNLHRRYHLAIMINRIHRYFTKNRNLAAHPSFSA